MPPVLLGRVLDDIDRTVRVADDHALAHIEEQAVLQNAEHAGQLGVNVLNVEACAEVQICDIVAVIGDEGLAVADAENRVPACLLYTSDAADDASSV